MEENASGSKVKINYSYRDTPRLEHRKTSPKIVGFLKRSSRDLL